MSAPTTSRFETMRGEIVTAIEGITSGADYRTTVKEVSTEWKDVKSVTKWPTVVVLFPNETIRAADDMRTIFNSSCNVVILAYTRHSGLDAIEHDLKRAILSLTTTHAVDSSGWILDVGENGGQFEVLRVDLPGDDVAMFGIRFSAYIQFQPSTF